MGNRQLSNRDRKSINSMLEIAYGLREFIGKKDSLNLIDDMLLEINGTIRFLLIDGTYIPHLKLLLKNPFLPEVVVDMGAVKFMVSGADVMRPGIVAISEGIREGQIVAVVDEKNRKPLCVAQALYDGKTMQTMIGGKVCKNLHWIGDGYWNHPLS
ncbi:MAG: RNA-binding protein [DPANN group archaeon]|nr:RNA-binding protein [DPANN group archaeon]